MRHSIVRWVLGAWLLAGGFSGSLRAAPAPSFVGLGRPAGLSDSMATSIDADGTAVAGIASAIGFGNDACAFVWTPTKGPVRLDGRPGQTLDTEARGICNGGSIVVGTAGAQGAQQALTWTAGSASLIPGVPTTNAQATDISAEGTAVVGWADGHAWRSTTAGLVWLDEPAGTAGSLALGISADGTVAAGTRWTLGGAGEACYWRENGPAIGIGDLRHSSARAVSADGRTIVGEADGDNGLEPFRWTEATGMVRLGFFEPGFAEGTATGVSGDGSVVVGWIDQAQPRAFLWTEAGGVQDLQQLLQMRCGLNLDGWTLSAASDISSDGLSIVGYGRNPEGQWEAWIATVPEPAGAGILLLCLGALRRWHRPHGSAAPAAARPSRRLRLRDVGRVAQAGV